MSSPLQRQVSCDVPKRTPKQKEYLRKVDKVIKFVIENNYVVDDGLVSRLKEEEGIHYSVQSVRNIANRMLPTSLSKIKNKRFEIDVTEKIKPFVNGTNIDCKGFLKAHGNEELYASMKEATLRKRLQRMGRGKLYGNVKSVKKKTDELGIDTYKVIDSIARKKRAITREQNKKNAKRDAKRNAKRNAKRKAKEVRTEDAKRRRQEKLAEIVSENKEKWEDERSLMVSAMKQAYKAICSMVTSWLSAWEKHKANGEPGLPGSPGINGAIRGLSTIAMLLLLKKNKAHLTRLKLGNNRIFDDHGHGTSCFLKIIRVLFNSAALGYEYKTMSGMFMKEVVFNEEHGKKIAVHVPMVTSLLRAIEDIDIQFSLYHATKVQDNSFSVKFGKGWAPKRKKGSKNGDDKYAFSRCSFKSFLTRDCGFNKNDFVKNNGRMGVMFCEGWEGPDMASLLCSFSQYKSSNVSIVFLANRGSGR